MASSSADAAEVARRQAESILAEGRFHSAPVPHPLHGLLQTIGQGLEEALSVVPKGVAEGGTIAPGGSATVWGLLAAVLLAIGGAIAVRGARAALLDGGSPAYPGSSATPVGPAELLRAATAAEREGRAGDAVRLHFRRGLALLLEGDRVQVGPAMLSAEVSRALRSRQFDQLARSFDEIAYGGRVATAEDAQDARRGWSTLLKSVDA
jgi:hypothetical protein